MYTTVLQNLGFHTHNQPYCIISNCPFSNYGFCQITHCFFDLLSTHYTLFSVWPSGTELGGALYILFPSVFVFFPQVSLVGFLFLLGLYISSLASCMGGLYGAPRILQCIAQERVIPALGFLGKGVGAYREMITILMCLYCGYFQNGEC